MADPRWPMTTDIDDPYHIKLENYVYLKSLFARIRFLVMNRLILKR